MTLDEAIKHCEEVAQEKRYEYQECLVVHDMENAMVCGKCGEEHEQLAEWLKELKQLREQEPCEDAINRKDVLNKIYEVCFSKEWAKFRADYGSKGQIDYITTFIEKLSPIQPKAKVGKMKIHNIKLDIHFCDDVLNGRKNFEIRYNDRGYQAGDLVKFIPVDGSFTENHEIKYRIYEITYVLSGWGLKEGYVVFGIKPCEVKSEE